jgi:hypothetical protein
MFSVEWRDRAFDQMQQVLDKYPASRVWIGAFLHLVKFILQVTPETPGESRETNARFWCIEPLAISYRVDKSRKIVYIDSIKEM